MSGGTPDFLQTWGRDYWGSTSSNNRTTCSEKKYAVYVDGRNVCVFKAPRTYTPVLGALVSPSGHSRGTLPGQPKDSPGRHKTDIGPRLTLWDVARRQKQVSHSARLRLEPTAVLYRAYTEATVRVSSSSYLPLPTAVGAPETCVL